jgi:hypothetical protein
MRPRTVVRLLDASMRSLNISRDVHEDWIRAARIPVVRDRAAHAALAEASTPADLHWPTPDAIAEAYCGNESSA